MEVVMKCTLVLLVIMLIFATHAQDSAMVLCTDHRNELAARGFTNIFQQNGKYCVVIADSSMEAFNDISEWFNSGLQSILATQEDEELEQWIKQREEEKEQGLLDEFVNWAMGKSEDKSSQEPLVGTADENLEQWIQRREKEKEQGLLDEFVNWVTGENYSGDMDRYQGPLTE